MTIIHLISNLGGGGAEQMVLQLSQQGNLNHKSIVFSLSGKLTTFEKHFKYYEIEYYFLGVESFKSLQLFNGLKKFNEILSNLEECVIHCHMFHAILFGMLHKIANPKTKLIFTLHTNNLRYRYQRYILFVTKFMRSADIIFSQRGKKWYLKANPTVIPNGTNLQGFEIKERSLPTDKIKFLFIGRISHEKNPFRLIQAAKQLINENITNFEINFVGNGILIDELSILIKKNHLERFIIIHGFQNDIKSFLLNNHCLVLPSIREGLPIVIIEAAASKVPIISTPVGSIPDFLNNSNAYLRNNESFHLGMKSVILNYNEAIIKSEKLFNEIKFKFDIKTVFDKHLKLYKVCLKNHKTNK